MKPTKRKKRAISRSDSHRINNVANSVIAAGRGAIAKVVHILANNVITVNVFGGNLWPITIFLLVVSITSITLVFRLLNPATPQKMTGEFKVAVANIIVFDENGERVEQDDGANVSNFIYHRLNDNFASNHLEFSSGEITRSIRYEIWSPAVMGEIKGNTPEEIKQFMEKRAEEISANIIIYGFIFKGNELSEFSPEFYVNYPGFEQAEEITGDHTLGSSLPIELPFNDTEFIAVENPALSENANILSLLTLGLAYYSVDQYPKAESYFLRAEQNAEWTDYEGKEIVYLLLSNANVQRAAAEKDAKYLSIAESYIEGALEINQDYARALVTLGGIYYLQALGDPENLSEDNINTDLLDLSERTFSQALKGDGLEAANIEEKVHFNLGQIFLTRYELSEADWLQQAQARFLFVTESFEAGNYRIGDLAGHAYARLGLISKLKGDNSGAIELYKKAVKLVSPHWTAKYYSIIGEIHLAEGQNDRAVEAYDMAFQTAKLYNDIEVEEYRRRLNELKESQQ